MKKKIILTGLILLMCTGFSSDSERVSNFPVKLMFNDKLEDIPAPYRIFNHEGNAYLPVRYLAEKMKFIVDFDPVAGTIIFEDDFVVGPSVTIEQAKLVAYEKYQLTKVSTPIFRNVTNDEFILRSDPNDLTPHYFVMEGINNQQEKVTVFVSTNQRENSFIKKAPKLDSVKD